MDHGKSRKNVMCQKLLTVSQLDEREFYKVVESHLVERHGILTAQKVWTLHDG